MATAELLMSIDAFAKLAGDGKSRELVEGKVVMMTPPKPWHGVICSRVAFQLGGHIQNNKLGWSMSCDAGIVTRRDPDSLRGADFAFYSYARLPDPRNMKAYPTVAPELVCEVMSEYDRWRDVMSKATEYLQAGVIAVCIFNPDSETITIVRGDREPQVLDLDDDFEVPDLLPGLRVQVREFFA
jgi:Uma2 family endonuclease